MRGFHAPFVKPNRSFCKLRGRSAEGRQHYLVEVDHNCMAVSVGLGNHGFRRRFGIAGVPEGLIGVNGPPSLPFITPRYKLGSRLSDP